MKYNTVLLPLLFCLWAGGCDLIDKSEYLEDYTPPMQEGADIRNILLEEYTGIQCSNCPKAARKALVLKQAYGGRLIVVSVHAGYFARPFEGYDLRTPAGTEYDAYFGVSGNPQGILNRMPYQGAAFYSMYEWDKVLQHVPEVSPVSLVLKASYEPKERSFSLDIDITRYHALEGAAFDLVLWLVEDHIPTVQIVEDGSLDRQYVQQHVFRGALNGTWGEPVAIPEKDGQHLHSKKEKYWLPADYKAPDCSVVAFISERTSKEIIQVASTALVSN